MTSTTAVVQKHYDFDRSFVERWSIHSAGTYTSAAMRPIIYREASSGRTSARRIAALCLGAFLSVPAGCKQQSTPPNVVAIADITANEAARGLHAGLWHACKQLGYTRYWNAPTHSDDSERQIDLMKRHRGEATAGLVLLPDSPTTPLTEVIKARDAGVPIVVLHDALAIDPGPGVYNVLSDAAAAARLGIERMYRDRPDDMPVAITGVSFDSSAVLLLERALQQALHDTHPKAHVMVIADERSGQRAAQEGMSKVMAITPEVGGVFALQFESIRAAVAQPPNGLQRRTRLVGFDLEAGLQQEVEEGTLDSLVVEDRFRMGEIAVQTLAALRRKEHPDRFQVVQPLLVTRESLAMLKRRPPFNGLDR